MRRLLYLFFLLSAALFFYEELIGLMIKTGVRIAGKARLAYRDLRIEDGQLVLQDAVLFDVSGGKSSYLLRSETIWIEWIQMFSFCVRLENPRLTLSSDIFKSRPLSSAKRPFAYEIQIEDGVLDWSDGALPPAQFSYLDKELNLCWQQGALQAVPTTDGWHIAADHLPFEFLAQHFFISDGSGAVSAAIDIAVHEGNITAVSLRAEGEKISFRSEALSIGGSFSLGWQAKQIKGLHLASLFLGTERLHLSIQEGSALSISSEIRHANLLATFQAGLGSKWEMNGEALVGSSTLPIAAEARAFFASSDSMWAEGTGRFGEATGHLCWEEEAWKFDWEGLGPSEGSILQGFAAVFDPRALGYRWSSGSLQGALEFGGKYGTRWESFLGRDLCVETDSFELECAHITLKEGEWIARDARLRSGLPVEWRGHARWNGEESKAIFEGMLGESRALASLSFDEPLKKAILVGAVGDFRFDGTVAFGSGFELSIPRFEGEIPAWFSRLHFPFSIESGRVFSIESGLEVRGRLSPQIGLQEWALACRAQQVALTYERGRIFDLRGEFYANGESFDWVGSHGMLALSLGRKTALAKISSPRIYWTSNGNAHFDIRLEEPGWDLLRIAGNKEQERIQIDPKRSHLFGAPLIFRECIWDGGSHLSAQFDAKISWALLESFLKAREFDICLAKQFEGDLQLSAAFEHGEQEGWQACFDASGAQWKSERGLLPLSCRLEGNSQGWALSSLEVGPALASCQFAQEGGVWHINQGKASWEGNGLSFDFIGRFSEGPRLDISVDGFKADLSRATKGSLSAKGSLEGRGNIAIDAHKIESNLDLVAKELFFGEFQIDNKGALHAYVSSDKKAYVTGIDCRVAAGGLNAYASADFFEFDFDRRRIGVQKGRVHIPSDWIRALPGTFDIDLFGDAESSFDGAQWSAHLQEASLPLFGAMCHMKNVDLFSDDKSQHGAALLSHQGKWASLSASIAKGEHLRGTLQLQEESSIGKEPLSIDWSYAENEGLTVDSIEGKFAGLDASMRAVGEEERSLLVGSIGIDFSRFSEWIPPDVAEVFHELEMGAGYELKGSLSIPKQDPSQLSFQGIFCGKEIDLFGYQFRTLMAQADLHGTEMRISDIKVSDLAGTLEIDQIHLQSHAGHPWTIEIPTLTIRDMRPSLFRKPNEEVGALTPLLVRHLTMTGFHGLLDDGKTYLASGNLFFVNSFKRETTVLDIPSNVFGRIIGLDLELLIPVEGDLSFELRDGYFQLTDLKNAFSEGERSEFFLVHSDTSPRMDLKGNLEILVTMKQFVLFALTEAFMISIDGKLSDPRFSLQKKRRFL